MSHQPKPNESNGDGRIFAILAYIIPVIGGVIGLVINRGNILTRNHAQQSIGAVLTIVLGFVTWMVSAYAISLAPAIRPVLLAATFVVIALGLLLAIYYTARLDTDDNIQSRKRSSIIRKAIWAIGIYGVGSVIYFLSQTSPETVEFAVPLIELLKPASELFMPVLILMTVIIIATGVVPSIVTVTMTTMLAINLLTWMPIAGPVISVSLYALVMALIIFLIVNWGVGLLRAVQGAEHVIPIANNVTVRIFGEPEKAKVAETA